MRANDVRQAQQHVSLACAHDDGIVADTEAAPLVRLFGRNERDVTRLAFLLYSWA